MKTQKIISVILSLIITISVFTSCANPVGESSTNTTSPTPADTAVAETKGTTETAAVPSAPIDLSVLKEEELEKFEGDLTETLKDDSVSEIRVNIFLKKNMTEQELDLKIEEQLKINEKKYSELDDKLEALYKQKEELEASSADKAEVDSLNKQISEIENERERYQPGYGYAVNIVINEYCQPVLDEFREKHELPSDTISICTTMSFNCVPLTKNKIIQIAQDDNVLAISPFRNTSGVHHFGPEEIPQYIST